GAVFCIKDLKVSSRINSSDIGLATINTVYPDPDNEGMLYMGTSDSKIAYGSFADEFKDKKVISIIDPEVDSVSGDGKDENQEAYDKPINWIEKDSGKIWVVRDDIVGWLSDSMTFTPVRNLPLTGGIGSVAEDYEGNLWFTSTRQGVMKIVANKFYNITERNALEEAVVNSTCMHNGYLYIGTDTGLQIFDNRNSLIKDKLVEHLKETRIRCIKEDSKKNLWISTYTNDLGLICYTNTGKIVSYTTKNGLLSNQIRATTESADGSILAATNEGLAVIKNEKVVRTVGKKEGMGNALTLTVEEDSNGDVYLGTDGGGIYVVSGNNLIHKGRDDGLTSDVILRIKKDEKRGLIWVITSNSIQYIKDGEIKEVKGFPYNNNYDIYFDKGENAWVLASNGFYVLKARDMIDKEEYDYQHYDFTSGLPSMATVNAFSELDEDGTLYVSGRTGVYSVNIDKYFEKTHDIKLCVPYVEYEGVKYYPDNGDTITLPSSADAITIYGYALTYSMQNPKIQYILDGVDDDYNTVFKTEMQPVRYTNLSGGSYSYQIRVTNISTGQVQQTAIVHIYKKKAFYEQVWFRVLLVLLGIALIAVVARIYMLRKTKIFLKKQENDKLLIREIVEAFSKTIDMKDRYTRGHSARVARYTVMLAEELGYTQEEVDQYYNIALLHDIGKIGVPEEVLNKQGKLTDEEFAIIKSHTTLGHDALKNISIMPELATGAGSHHERPDGHGYPEGLTGKQIPRVAQIIAVADTFDAMYSDRPYRKRMNFDKAVSIIKDVSGTQLASDVVDAFLRLVDKGYFRAKDDDGGGSTEDINNIRKAYDKDGAKKDN
ncbi:MAG: HD domain-containing protein, partial [Eubacterium sp.]|nr:HD domain-containing protein [Eubacterium sp.]